MEFPNLVASFINEVHRTMITTTITVASAARTRPSPSENQWRTGVREQAYRRRLLEALRSARVSRRASAPRRQRAADSELALIARGQSRGSRSIHPALPP
ncbi:hypothetical protein OPV22_023829 [Ensete ventricosum]|uniref:Uncharacterized protein n=1 Tax=Ensete ventricosum TaxID=4639 RepID=A0AAV8QMP8_ENSVE|nr:hypothetical protein OPV22_023829 [Ensete ventricosum]RWW36853.1 hypothetical protein BHE74_00058090 [Ensete ventricosum]RZS28526.1 hypothetical protein BHM03_00062125 [Ensete ventricosum]